MPTTEEIRTQIEFYSRRLRELKKQRAIYGFRTDPGVLIEIEEIEIKLRELQAELDELVSSSHEVYMPQSVNDPQRIPPEKLSSTSPLDTQTTFLSDVLPIDFVIVTALEEERDAVLAKLPGYQKLVPFEDDVRVYFLSDLPVTFSDGSLGYYRIILMPLLSMGRVQATIATADAIRRWSPRYVLLVGIAGGIATKIKLGDILVSDQIVDYEVQKLTATGPQIRWETYRADPRLLNAARNFSYERWQELIAVKRPGRGISERHIGPIASGDKVIAFGDVLSQYLDKWPRLMGVEMEAAGVATASFQAARPPGFFMVRGISDLADEKKNSSRVKKWRSYACDIAASYTIALLKSGPVILSARSLVTEDRIAESGETHQSTSNIPGQFQGTTKMVEGNKTSFSEHVSIQRWKKERIQSLEQQLTILFRNKNFLEERYYSRQVSSEVINDLEHVQEAIERVTDELKTLGVRLDEPQTPKTTSVIHPSLWFYENEELTEIIELSNRGKTPITIGRSRDRDIRIDWKYHRVSGKHAYMVVETDCIRLFDEGSEFGTYVNSKPIDGKVGKALKDGDQIILGGLGGLSVKMAIGTCYFVYKTGSYQ